MEETAGRSPGKVLYLPEKKKECVPRLGTSMPIFTEKQETAHAKALPPASLDRPFTSETLHALFAAVCRHVGVRAHDYRAEAFFDAMQTHLAQAGLDRFDTDVTHLETDVRQWDVLADRIFLSASHFFRDPYVFEVLHKFVVPLLVANMSPSPLLVWSAGCARGEEAYSIALLFDEARKTVRHAPEVFVLGSDLNQEALDRARQGLYARQSLLEVKTGMLDDCFQAHGARYALRPLSGVRVQFARHDILSGELPRMGIFADYHLILCRNVLMYCTEPARQRTVALFERALVPGGWLVLGPTESLPPEHAAAFEETARGANVFRKRGNP